MKFGQAAARAAIVWFLSWPLSAFVWYVTAAILLPRWLDPAVVSGVSAWVFSVLLAGYEFRRCYRHEPPAP